MLKRAFDTVAAGLGLLLLLPVLLAIAIAVKLSSPGPVFYRQVRVGRGAKLFHLYKFRSMIVGADRTSRLTTAGDPRVTKVGRFLRDVNLDELPQIFNVLRGDMSLVGPRPEVPEFVDLADPRWRAILSVRPGMTSPESIAYRREGEILAQFADPAAAYQVILTRKLDMAVAYVRTRTFASDLSILARTFKAILWPTPAEAGEADEAGKADDESVPTPKSRK